MDSDSTPYQELGEIVEQLFTACDDDPICVAKKLDTVTQNVREELLRSDLLNAFQVFYYFFHKSPDILAEEILLFHPASHLVHGISLIKNNGPYEMIFFVKQGVPEIVLLNEDNIVIETFSGADAYKKAISYIRENS
jgi:hypothetical protein